MLKILKRALVPGRFSRSRFQISFPDLDLDLIKRNRPVIFSHHQLKKGSAIRDRVWTTYQNGKVAYHDRWLNAVSTAVVRVRFPQLTISKISKTSKRCCVPKVVSLVVDHNIHNIWSWNINGKFCSDKFFVLDKERTYLRK